MVTSIQVDNEVWENAKKIFEKSGITITDAINMFLYKVQEEEKLPFEMDEPTKEEILQGLKEAVEEVNLYNEGKIKLIDAKELLNEL